MKNKMYLNGKRFENADEELLRLMRKDKLKLVLEYVSSGMKAGTMNEDNYRAYVYYLSYVSVLAKLLERKGI